MELVEHSSGVLARGGAVGVSLGAGSLPAAVVVMHAVVLPDSGIWLPGYLLLGAGA